MIDPALKENIMAMFLSGSETTTVLAMFPTVGKTTIYNIRGQAMALKDSGAIQITPERPTGVIGDTHLPFCHPRYLEFIKDTFEQYNVGPVIHIGDLIDNHAISYHESDPDGYSAGHEFQVAMDEAQEWYRAFEEVMWMAGNHDDLPKRRIKSAGLPKRLLRENVYGTPPGWQNREKVIINDVHYSHGIGMAGKLGARNHAVSNGMSSVIGHCHSFGGINYIANPFQIYYGLNVGCGIDIEAYAMAYGKNFPNRPTLGCGIVFSSQVAMFIPMDMRRYSRHAN